MAMAAAAAVAAAAAAMVEEAAAAAAVPSEMVRRECAMSQLCAAEVHGGANCCCA